MKGTTEDKGNVVKTDSVEALNHPTNDNDENDEDIESGSIFFNIDLNMSYPMPINQQLYDIIREIQAPSTHVQTINLKRFRKNPALFYSLVRLNHGLTDVKVHCIDQLVKVFQASKTILLKNLKAKENRVGGNKDTNNAKLRLQYNRNKVRKQIGQLTMF